MIALATSSAHCPCVCGFVSFFYDDELEKRWCRRTYIELKTTDYTLSGWPIGITVRARGNLPTHKAPYTKPTTENQFSGLGALARWLWCFVAADVDEK
jgi:hypothetical protein